MANASFTVDAQLGTKEFLAGSKELQKAIESVRKTTAEAGQNMQTSSDSYVQSMKNAINAAVQNNKEVAALEHKAASLRSQLQSVANTRVYSPEYMQLVKDMEKADEAMERLQAKKEKYVALGEPQDSKTMESLAYDMTVLEDKYASLAEKKAQLDMFMNGSTSSAETEQFQQMSQALAETERQLESLKDYSDQTFNALPQSKLQEYAAIIQHAFSNVGSSIGSFIGNAVQGVGRVVSFMGQLAGSATRAAVSVAKIVASNVLSFLKRLAVSAKNAAVNLAKIAGNAITTGLKKLGSLAMSAAKSLLSVGKSAKKSGGGFQLSFKNILRYGLGIRSLFVLFNRLRRAITDSLGTMAKVDEPTNKAISSIVTALNQLKGSLGSAFQPIITAVAPYLTQLMNLLSSAMTKIAEFFALLTGQKYVLQATAVQTDYAKSLDNTSKSSKKATKEAKNQLAAFDSLNILSDSSNDGADTSTSATDPSQMFKKIPVASMITDFLKELKEAFEKGDYFSIGTILAGKINEALTRARSLISWDNVGDTVTKYVNAITSAFNGLTDPNKGINFELIGSTIATGMNTVVRTISTFMDGVEWKNLGKAIGNTLNGFFKDFDFKAAGELLGKRINAVFAMVRYAVNTFKWGESGKNFGKLVAGLKDEVKWNEIGETLRNLAKGVLAFIRNAINSFELGDLGTKLAGTLNSFFSDESLWTDAGQAINDGITEFLDFATMFLSSLNVEQLALDIRAALKEIKWGEIAKQVWEAAKLAFSKLGDFVNILLGGESQMRWDIWAKEYVSGGSAGASGLGATIGKKISSIFGEIPWSGIWDVVSTTIKGIFNFASAFLQNLDPVQMAEDLKGFLNDTFDKINWSEVGLSLGEFMADALTALADFISELILGKPATELIEELGKKLTKGAEDYVKAHPLDPEAVKAWATHALDEIGLTAQQKEILSISIKDALDNGAEKSEVRDIVQGLLNDLGVSIDEDKFELAWNSLWALYGNPEIEADVTTIVDGTADASGTSQKISKAVESETYTADVQTVVLPDPETLLKGQDAATKYRQGFTEQAEKEKESLKTSLTGMVDYAVNAVEKETLEQGSPSKRAKRSGEWYAEGFGKGVESEKKDTASTVSSAFNSIVDVSLAMAGMTLVVTLGMAAVKAAFTTSLDSIETSFKTHWKTITDATTQSTSAISQDTKTKIAALRADVTTTMTTITRTITSQATTLNTTIQNRFSSIRDNIVSKLQQARNSASNVNWYSVGSDIINGIQRGINGGWNWLNNTVNNLARSLFNTARRALGIHSPSKLFADGVGMMIGLGIGEGLENSEPQVMEGVMAIADAIADGMAMADTTMEMDVSGAGLLDGLDNVLTTFSGTVSDSFAELVSTLDNIASSASFRIPVVATGTVVPYNIAGQFAASDTAPIADAIEASNDDLASVVMQVVNNATRAIVDAIQRNNGYQGTTSVSTDAIINEINRRAKAQGHSPILI